MLSIHPLVHSWSRERMEKSEQQRLYEIGSAILTYAIPWKCTSQDYALRALIFPHIKANELYARQMELIEQYFDDKWAHFSLVMDENGNWDNVEQMELQAMNMRKKVLGAEHPYTLVSIGNLANAYCSQGRWKEAEQLQVQVMNMRKKVLGAEHPDTLISMAHLATTYYSQNRWNEAEQLQVQVMNMRKKVLGAEHPDTLISMAHLATTYYSQDRWNEAEQLQVQVMDMRKKVLGAEHPHTLTSMNES
jgi:tetratricopeptide (TPR) repeat protein